MRAKTADTARLSSVYYRDSFLASPEVMVRIFAGEAMSPSEYYFRTTPVYETASEKYSWLNRIVAVAEGRVKPNWVGYTTYAVL